MGGIWGNVIVCVDYSVSGSGAIRADKGGWGHGGVAIPAVYTLAPLMTVVLPHASPQRLHGLGLERLHVVQQLEVTRQLLA